MNDLFKQLGSLRLPRADYAITENGPLYAHGLILILGNDLDIVARNNAGEIRQFNHQPFQWLKREKDILQSV